MNRTTLPIFAVVLMAGCATTPDCRQETGFEDGLAGQTAQASCEHDDYLDAYRLGAALEEMYREREHLLGDEGGLDAADRARLRALERDIP